MDKILVLLLCFYGCHAGIKINKLDVPPAILYGSQDDVVLDCDFDSGGDAVTEIKWYLDGDRQIYQWLPNTNVKAQAIGKLKNHIDVNYKATNDEHTMYRALHITDLSPNFSGNYTCKVSGPTSEDVATKRMIIYETPDDDLELTLSEEESQIFCHSSGLFPSPNMTIYITTDGNETEIAYQENDEIVDFDEDEGLYNVSASLYFNFENLTNTFYYTCEVSIPGTPFSINETREYDQEVSSEVELDEDFPVFNSTNSTESSFEEAKEIETQIEEETFSSTSEAPNNLDDADVTPEDTNLEENGSWRSLPSLLATFLITALLAALCL